MSDAGRQSFTDKAGAALKVRTLEDEILCVVC